jgi:hypothetical protein
MQLHFLRDKNSIIKQYVPISLLNNRRISYAAVGGG